LDTTNSKAQKGLRPNTRVQRTRSSPSAHREPLTRHTLGSLKAWFFALTLLGCAAALRAGNSGLALRVTGPRNAKVGQAIVLRFTAANTGRHGYYFMHPWKWADNGLLVEAISTDGSRVSSTPRLFDIDAKYACTYFKPMYQGDQFSFEESVVVGPEPDWRSLRDSDMKLANRPHLDLRPGRYKLMWVYSPLVDDFDRKCATAGWAVWTGKAESNLLEVEVAE
jgi:hypothetical protein